jgi:lysophospholipase L1-like esterase
VAYGFDKLSPSGAQDPLLVAAVLTLSSLFLFIYLMIHARRLSKARYFALVLVILSGDALVVSVTRPRAWPVDHVHISRLSLADWSVEALHDDLLHLEHPLLRRWNVYLAQHELRDRTYALKKKPGTTRIVALGASSTHGYWVKAPYPFCLEHLLNEEGHDVEVIVGAYPGATGPRLLPFFKNVLLDFEPDIVTLSLYYNDAYALTQFDESAYLARVTEGSHSLLDAAKARVEIALGAGVLARLERLFQEGGDMSGEVPARFEAMLTDFARVCEANGVKLVLIKEPVKGDLERIWKREFRDAMDRVGAAFGLPVIDPTPLLLERGGATLFMDNVHPFLEGGIVIAESMLPAMRELLAR